MASRFRIATRSRLVLVFITWISRFVSALVPRPPGLTTEKILQMAQRRYGQNNHEPMKNRVVVVTGAAGGMGQEICKTVYSLGADVVAMDCNKDGLDKLKGILPKLTILETDHSDLRTVAKAARAITNKFDKIDVLVNNAGITYYKGVAGVSKHGLDLAFTINYLSHVLLSALLKDTLDADGRIIQLTSSYHWKVDGSELLPTEKKDLPPQAALLPNPSPHHVGRIYANTKLAQIWHAQELSRRYDIHAIAVCPTWVGTNIGGEQTRGLLEGLAFDPQGPGLTSALNALLRTNDELGTEVLCGRRMVANSRILEYLLPLKVLLTSDFVAARGWRDAVADFLGLLLLLGQSFTHSEWITQDGSPESIEMTKEMEALHDWSTQETKEWMNV